MIGVKPCIDKSVMENSDRCALSSPSLPFTPPIKTLGTPTQPGSTPRISTMRPLATAYKASTSDYQVISDRQTPKKMKVLYPKQWNTCSAGSVEELRTHCKGEGCYTRTVSRVLLGFLRLVI